MELFKITDYSWTPDKLRHFLVDTRNNFFTEWLMSTVTRFRKTPTFLNKGGRKGKSLAKEFVQSL